MSNIWLIIGIILIALAVFAFFKAYQTREKKPAEPGKRTDPFKDAVGAENFGPDILGPGAVLSHGGVDYVVRGSLTITQGAYTWYEHMLQGNDGPAWLSVEVEEGQLELIFWNSRKGVPMEPQSRLEWDGWNYKELERGRAEYTSEGTTGLAAQGTLRYVDYEGQGDARLSLEQFDGAETWEVSTGTAMSSGDFVVYPAPRS